MIRLISFIGLLSWAIAVSPALAQTAPVLKAAVRVSDPIVTIGDLVANAGEHAGLPVFRAPDLGETGSVPAADIVAAIAARGVTQVDTGGLRTVRVMRDSRVIPLDDLREPLSKALATFGADPASLSIELAGKAAAVHLPVEADGAVEIEDAVWNAKQGTFDAIVTATRIDGQRERRAISGMAFETATILAVRRDLSRGAVLSEGDVELRRVPRSELSAGTLTDLAGAAGLEVRRPLREGHVLRASDLAEPTLVKGSSIVTVVLKSGGLTLTASGQALKDGKRGETIPVMNTQSKRVLQGVVTNFNEVAINPPRAVVSAAK